MKMLKLLWSFSSCWSSSKLRLTLWGRNFTVCVYFIDSSPAPFSLAVKGMSEFTEALAVTMSLMDLDITSYIHFCSCRVIFFFFCLVLWYNQTDRRIEKFFSWLHFYASLVFLKNTSTPKSIAKKCLDAHMLKITRWSVLLGCGIGLEINVYRFGPLDFF